MGYIIFYIYNYIYNLFISDIGIPYYISTFVKILHYDIRLINQFINLLISLVYIIIINN